LYGTSFLFALDLVVPAAHKPLDRVDCPLGIGDRLALGWIPDKPITLVGKCDDAWGQPVPLLVGDHLDLAPFHDRDHGIGGPQVNPDDFFFRHVRAPGL
jgi:hypothetical protein